VHFKGVKHFFGPLEVEGPKNAIFLNIGKSTLSAFWSFQKIMSKDREASAADVNKKLSKLMLEDVSQRSNLSTSSRRSSKRKNKQKPRIICMDLLNFAEFFFKFVRKQFLPGTRKLPKLERRWKSL
jgi:hypothetical protein